MGGRIFGPNPEIISLCSIWHAISLERADKHWGHVTKGKGLWWSVPKKQGWALTFSLIPIKVGNQYMEISPWMIVNVHYKLLPFWMLESCFFPSLSSTYLFLNLVSIPFNNKLNSLWEMLIYRMKKKKAFLLLAPRHNILFTCRFNNMAHLPEQFFSIICTCLFIIFTSCYIYICHSRD